MSGHLGFGVWFISRRDNFSEKNNLILIRGKEMNYPRFVDDIIDFVKTFV